MDQVGETLDAVVIGAGWAGLGMAYCLREAGLDYCVLERARIGETWRTQRWDSFHFNLPNCYSVLPGDTYDGNDPEGFMTHTEFFAYLDDYSRRHNLRVLCSTPATKLDVDGTLRAHTPGGTLRARSVVVASGSLNRPPSSARSVKTCWAIPDRCLRLPQCGAAAFRSSPSSW
jgi:putative flavoprotein involved in K+ transport